MVGTVVAGSDSSRGGGWRDHRLLVEAIAWKYRTGSPWRDLPGDRFGPWQTAYERHNRWSADGTWAQLLAAAQADADARGDLDWLVAADASLMRVHQHGATARRVGGNAATAERTAADPDSVTGGGVELQELPGRSPGPGRGG
jgi:transposase